MIKRAMLDLSATGALAGCVKPMQTRLVLMPDGYSEVVADGLVQWDLNRTPNRAELQKILDDTCGGHADVKHARFKRVAPAANSYNIVAECE